MVLLVVINEMWQYIDYVRLTLGLFKDSHLQAIKLLIQVNAVFIKRSITAVNR